MALSGMYGEIPENERLAQIAARILDEIFKDAMQILWHNLDERKLRNTDKLYHSINKQIHAKYQEGVVEAVLMMDRQGVFHDMKTLKYTGAPPLDEMIKMVRRGMPGGGRSAGPYPYYAVPGYKSVSQPTTEAHIKKIAGAIRRKRIQQPTVRRAGSPWLSKVIKEKVLETFSEDIMKVAHHFISSRSKEWWKDFANQKSK